MFRRSTGQSPFWQAAALLTLLAAAHTLLAQDAPPTVRADVTNWTAKPIEFALVGPDGKNLGPARSVEPGYVYRTNDRTLPGGSAKGYKWVVRDPATKQVLKEVPADRTQQSIPVGIWKRVGEEPKESRLAHVTNGTAKPIEFALVGPDGKDLGPARSVQPGIRYQTSLRTLPGGSAKGYKWVARDPATKRVLKEVPADRTYQSISVGIGKGIGDVPKETESAQTVKVSAPPDAVKTAFKLSPFYKKYVSAQGFPVVGSAKVSDAAMREAAYLINQMLINRDDVRKALIENKVRFAIMAPSEKTTDIPEHSDMPLPQNAPGSMTPKAYWDKRARGLGATPERPAVSCGEENLLNLQGDWYPGENILIHEFAHAIHIMGLNTIDKTFDARLLKIYTDAMAKKRWAKTYAATNWAEYWAEGVQSYFDCNDANNAEHGDINTREKLARYDPELFQLIDETFRKPQWRYVRYDKRSGTPSTVADAGKLPAPTLQVKLTVLNTTGSSANLYYIREGKRTLYHRIAPGMKVVQDTYSGHMWEIVLDGSKEPLSLEMPRNDYNWRLR